MMPGFQNILQRAKIEEIFPNSFCKGRITLIPKGRRRRRDKEKKEEGEKLEEKQGEEEEKVASNFHKY